MNYQDVAARGWPIGSGAVESRAKKQRRFKRPASFGPSAACATSNALIAARELVQLGGTVTPELMWCCRIAPPGPTFDIRLVKVRAEKYNRHPSWLKSNRTPKR